MVKTTLSMLFASVGFAFALVASTLARASETASMPTVTIARLTLEVDLSAETKSARFDPARDRVGVRGAVAPLSWQRSIEMRPIGADRYAVTLEFARDAVSDQPLQYKLKIEGPTHGGTSGWENGRNRVVWMHEANVTVKRTFDSPPEPIPVMRTGHIDRIAPDAWPASKHVEPREIQVWLPPGYAEDKTRRYPVLYMHDGQNLFDAASAGAEWRVDETAQRMVLAREISPFIIVAISNTAKRTDEYTPVSMLLPSERSRTGAPERAGGAAHAYANYLIDEVKPMIDARYRTLSDRVNTSVGGSSLGGLVSLWLALTRGDIFGAALVVSPSVWWGDGYLIELAKRQSTFASRPRLWIDIGTRETTRAVPDTRNLRDALMARGWKLGDELQYQEFTDASHDEAAWARRVPQMLRFLDSARVATKAQSHPVANQ